MCPGLHGRYPDIFFFSWWACESSASCVSYLVQPSVFFLKSSKCCFAQQALEYLGHIVTASGVSTDPAKIKNVAQWPVPKSIKNLRGFLGLAGYYRRFIKHYGIMNGPLTHLLEKDVPFIWSPTAQAAFDDLKQALTNAPVLALPDFGKQYVLETDACNSGIGAVLMRKGIQLLILVRAWVTPIRVVPHTRKNAWRFWWL